MRIFDNGQSPGSDDLYADVFSLRGVSESRQSTVTGQKCFLRFFPKILGSEFAQTAVSARAGIPAVCGFDVAGLS